MDYNYHAHTKRCGHASGTEEEYIVRAIGNGIKYMGFSDHAPLRFKSGFESDWRVPTDEAGNYVQEIRKLREKYKNEIDIKIGFEMEYYPALFDEMLKNAVEYGAEYLILGPHYIEEENKNLPHAISENEDVKFLKSYTEMVVSAIKTGVFTYVAHPDIINFTGDKEIFLSEMRKICIASREYNIPLEINFLGIRDNRNYPNEAFLKLAGEEKCPVTFGFDAHTVEAAFDGESLVKAKELVKKFNLNYIGKPDVILIQEI